MNSTELLEHLLASLKSQLQELEKIEIERRTELEKLYQSWPYKLRQKLRRNQ